MSPKELNFSTVKNVKMFFIQELIENETDSENRLHSGKRGKGGVNNVFRNINSQHPVA